MTVRVETTPMRPGLLRFATCGSRRRSLAFGIALAAVAVACEPDWDVLVSGNHTGGGGVSASGSAGSPAASGGAEGGAPPLASVAGESAGGSDDTITAGSGGAEGGAGGSDSDGGGVVESVNLALGRLTTASSEESSRGNYAVNATDGKVDTRWCANDGTPGHWLHVDLGASYTLTGAEIFWEKADTKYKYTIEVSLDDTTWTNVVDQSMNDAIGQTATHAFSTDARYLRVTQVAANDPSASWASLFELRVMGDPESGVSQ